MSAAISSTDARPLFSSRPFGFEPRWLIRHAVPCGGSPVALRVPRYIGGAAPLAPAAKAVCAAFTPRDYRSLRRRLDRWELEHLREHAAKLAEQLDVERRARQQAEDAADFWREQALSIELREGERFGLAMDGTVRLVTATEHRLKIQPVVPCLEGGAA